MVNNHALQFGSQLEIIKRAIGAKVGFLNQVAGVLGASGPAPGRIVERLHERQNELFKSASTIPRPFR